PPPEGAGVTVGAAACGGPGGHRDVAAIRIEPDDLDPPMQGGGCERGEPLGQQGLGAALRQGKHIGAPRPGPLKGQRTPDPRPAKPTAPRAFTAGGCRPIAREWADGSRRRSRTTTSTPRCASRAASSSPHGPPPTISTSQLCSGRPSWPEGGGALCDGRSPC